MIRVEEEEEEEEEVVVGCVGLRLSSSSFSSSSSSPREGEVVRLSVRADRQGRGVGSQLLSWVEEEAVKAQVCLLRATTLGEEALPGALGWYGKRGWVVEGTKGFGSKGEEGELVHICKAL